MSISMDKTIEFKKNSPLSSLAFGWVPTDAELGAEYVFVTDLMNENARAVKETSGCLKACLVAKVYHSHL